MAGITLQGMIQLLQGPFVRMASKGRRGPLLAALLAFIVALPCALMLPPLDRDELRFVQASAQMMETHDFIKINVQEVPRYKKPVGIHWLQVAAVKLTSKVAKRDIFPYRLPSLLGAALAAFACAWGASYAFGTRIGTKAGLLFAVTFMLSTEAFWAKTDAVQCGLVTLMMASLAQIYLRTRDLGMDDPRPKMPWLKLVFWLAVAGTILIKIIIGPMILAATLLTLFAWDRKVRWARNLSSGWGLILVLLICGPWFMAITVATDGQFWVGAVGKDFADKISGGSEGHGGWPGYHLALLPITLFPAAWFLGGALQTAISRRHEAAIRFAIAWFLPAFIIFELSPTKLPHYTLPAFGALIWLCAVSMDVPLKTWAKALNVTAGTIGGLVISVIAIAGYHLYGASDALIFVVAVVSSALALAVLGGWLMWRNRQRAGFAFLLAAGILTHLSFVSELAHLKPLWISKMLETALVTAHLDPRQGVAPGPVAIIGYAEPSFVFAMGTKTELLNEDAKGAVAALREGRPVFVESKFEKAFQAEAKAAGIVPHAVSQIKGHNYNGHDQALTLYSNTPTVSK
ncbi:Undecaprenyl phosphate-alpha-4-amino-4-deoxy-L-arabinose arabinosyl transferase [Asticcacaulis sp. MM231]|uniref:ArnT family glycosyltransferase n=1 Tax=Asticcacaulis sp. MM231 TaxID=3157666 RepID=UPI0032D584E3